MDKEDGERARYGRSGGWSAFEGRGGGAKGRTRSGTPDAHLDLSCPPSSSARLQAQSVRARRVRRGRAGTRRTNPSGTTFAARYPQAVEGPSGYPSPPSPATDLARSTYGAPMPASFPASGADGPGPGSMSVARPAAIPAEVLLQELPDVTAGSLIPLAEVVDASVNEIYKRLVELQDVLPSRHEKARAREVFQFALWARRECVRLLAVVRWCREGPAVAKALVRPAIASTPLTTFGSRRRDASAWLRS
jgi:hypothetical protein